MGDHLTRLRDAIATASDSSVVGVPVVRARQHIALADAVTRLGEARTLYLGLMFCSNAGFVEISAAADYELACLYDVLDRREALVAGVEATA